MPSKHAHKGRTWGTRYDSLPTSPPTSPPRPHTHTQADAGTAHSPTIQPTADDKNTSVHAAVVRSEKSRNDSSIFVGSLPTNMAPEEVGRALSQHLAEHAEILSIKAINDKKGSMCAFIQCQDDEGAARLLYRLQNISQRPFFGRNLRFELARSPRTLLISYRIPTQQAYPNSGFDTSDDIENGVQSLPKAMRIVRSLSGKCTFLWDTAALEYDESLQGTAQLTLSEQSVAKNKLFSPLKFDADTLREIVQAFGPVEHFGVYVPKPEEHGGQDNAIRSHIPEHSGPRASGVENGVWEIKWEQRDDCAAALSALRRAVPHLVVTWAHHHVSALGQDSRFASPVASPSPHSACRFRTPQQSRPYMSSSGEYQRFGDPRLMIGQALSPSTLRLSSSSSVGSVTSPTLKHWAPTYCSPQLRGPSSPVMEHGEQDTTTDATLVPDWTEASASHVSDIGWSAETHLTTNSVHPLPWMLHEEHEDELSAGVASVSSPSPSSSLSAQPATPISGDALKLFDDDQPEVTLANPVEHSEVQDQDSVPLTPDASYSSVMHNTPKTSHSSPQTPQKPANTSLPGVNISRSCVLQTTPKKNGRSGARGDGFKDVPEFDPTTIWVGGLDTSKWGEARVRAVFDKYGCIEDLEFHTRTETPSFAFVKFSGMEASTRAVSGENDRYYDGRPIRVAHKQINSLARGSPMKFSRGRGRQRPYSGHQQRLQDVEVGNSNSSPGRAALHDPFRVSSRSPASTSHLSAKKEFPESSVNSTLPVSQPSTSSNAASGYPFAFDVFRDRPVSANSSASPASVAQSSVISGPMSPYGYFAHYPWLSSYGYHIPYYYPPMAIQQPAPPNRDGADSSAQPSSWAPTGQLLKGPAGFQHPPQGDGVQMQGPFQQPSMQPPLHPIGFCQHDQGALIPVYSQEALVHYQTTKTSQSQSPPPQGLQSHPGPPPGVWYHPMQMHQYPYPYHQVPYPPGQMPPHMAVPQPSNSGWGTSVLGPYPTQRSQPILQGAQQATPPPHMVPTPSSSSTSISSFGPSQPPPAYHEHNVGPRHALINRRFSRNTPHQGHQLRNSTHRFNNRTGYPMEPSPSYVYPSQGQQHQGPVRISGSYPGHLGGNVPQM